MKIACTHLEEGKKDVSIAEGKKDESHEGAHSPMEDWHAHVN